MIYKNTDANMILTTFPVMKILASFFPPFLTFLTHIEASYKFLIQKEKLGLNEQNFIVGKADIGSESLFILIFQKIKLHSVVLSEYSAIKVLSLNMISAEIKLC